MKDFKEKLSVLSAVVRAYSLPISITSWFVPFLYSALRKGSILYGVIALFGIVFLHCATNLFDDIIDFVREKRLIDKGYKTDFNFQNAKCFWLRNGEHTLKQYIILLGILFTIPFLCAIFFLFIYGIKLLYIIVPTFILCLLYPILGCLGLGELLVALIFSPLLYFGVNFVMTGSFSSEIFFVSISTGLLAVAVLHNHMLLDFNCDEKNRKITLCRLCITKENALILLVFIISCAYISLILSAVLNKISYIYPVLTVFSVPTAVTLINVMKIHIKSPEQKIPYNIFMGNINEVKNLPENQQGFLLKFLLVRNLMNYFTLCICIATVIECILSKN